MMSFCYIIYLRKSNDKQSNMVNDLRMEDKKVLLNNIELVHTTEMGVERIKRNLKLETNDVVEYCRQKISNNSCNIYRQGKNWYCEIEDVKITVNAYSYTIITAHYFK